MKIRNKIIPLLTSDDCIYAIREEVRPGCWDIHGGKWYEDDILDYITGIQRGEVTIKRMEFEDHMIFINVERSTDNA